ncbi:QRFP-like peptide receptor isoform X1 [Pomacea canaliculata]|uniref:QRFP-like peptide receptor isoform X1 n=1 Tax=Pomacea canaliculata TaxID=400727 RepID=UPI000D73B502|nr:QRFP-like peptide receptor isoform X1 [Pomacea canaliculata]
MGSARRLLEMNETAIRHSANVTDAGHLLHSTCTVGAAVPEDTSLDPSFFLQFDSPSPPQVFPPWEVALKVTFYVIAFLLDVVGNVMVLLIISLNKRMRSATNVLLLNLAVSDLMVAAFCMWAHLGNQITSNWPFGPFVCKINTFIQVTSVTASVLTLTAISLERFMAIVFPLKARWTSAVNVASIVTTWLLSVAVASPHLFVRRQFQQTWRDRQEVWCDEQWAKEYRDKDCNTWEPGKVAYYSVEGIVMYFLPVLVMIIAYTIIGVKLLTRKAPGILITSTAFAQEKAKRKVIKMLVAVLTAFVVCWTPQQVMLLWDLFRPRVKVPDYVKTVKYSAVYVAYFNSALNPILYGGFNDNFRRGFRDVFRCLRKNKVHPDRLGLAGERGNTPCSSRDQIFSERNKQEDNTGQQRTKGTTMNTATWTPPPSTTENILNNSSSETCGISSS